jgi:hypothetical protein
MYFIDFPAQEEQEFFSDDEVFLVTHSERGTLRLKVVKTTSNKGRWYLKLSEGGNRLYENGAWVSQKKVTHARRGANR